MALDVSLTTFQIFFGDMLVYTSGRFFGRASILLFYIRIFPPKQDKRFGRLLIYTMVFNFVYNLAFFLAILLQCQPLPYFWMQWEGLHQGHCGNYNILAWVAAATGIVFDVWMLALPLSQLLALSLPWRKKIMGGLMFFFGVGCVSDSPSSLCLVHLPTTNNPPSPSQRRNSQPHPPQNHQRIHPNRQPNQSVSPSLSPTPHLNKGTNPNKTTEDIVQVCLWSNIELDVGVICPCLPSFRLLLRRVLGRSPSSRDTQLSPAPPRKSSVGSAADPLGLAAMGIGVGNGNSVVVKFVGGGSSEESVVELVERRG